MDVKACDVCKKTNLEGELFSFFEYKTAERGKIAVDVAVAGFSFRKATPRDAQDIEMGLMRDTELVCKTCGEKKIAAVMAIL